MNGRVEMFTPWTRFTRRWLCWIFGHYFKHIFDFRACYDCGLSVDDGTPEPRTLMKSRTI